ncbi:MAG: hypothetical protein AAF394_14865, partial [Planctomycetota bacterium]
DAIPPPVDQRETNRQGHWQSLQSVISSGRFQLPSRCSLYSVAEVIKTFDGGISILLVMWDKHPACLQDG